RELALAVIHVLVRHRHAVQRPAAFAGSKLGIHRLGLLQRLLLVDAQEGVGPRLPGLDTGEAGFGCGHRCRAPGGNRIGDGSEIAQREVFVLHERASFAMTLAKAAGSSSKVRCAAAALRTASFRISTSAASSASRFSSYFMPCRPAAMPAA